MRRELILIAVILLMAGCTQRVATSIAERGPEGKGDGRYDYMLTEALRQKYVGEVSEAARLFERCIEINSGRAVPYFELAQIYSAAEMGERALQHASRAARLEPQNYWYQLACGSLFTQYQQKDSALVYFKRALAADETAVEVNTILAGLYAEKGEAEKADSLFRVVNNEGGMSDDIFLMMISGLIMKKDYREAAERTIRLIENQPDEIRYKALLADIYTEAGETGKSDSIYREVIEKNPDDIETQLLYMMNLVYKKEYNGISVFLNKVFESDAVERERKVSVAQRIITDTSYVKDNSLSLEESLMILENKYPGDEEILSIRPAMYETAGESDKARERYEEIIKGLTQGFFFKEKLIIIYAEERDYAKLYKLTAEYSRDNNRSILGKVYYAIAAMELKEYSVAEAELKKALILAGNNDEMKIQILSIMGDLMYRMKRYEDSYALYEEALGISPDEPLLLNNYAYFLAESDGDLKKALKMAVKVMEKEGDNDTYKDTYAWVLYKLGRYREADKVMTDIYNKEGERNAEVTEHLGYIKKALERCSEAVKYWKQAIEEDSTRIYLNEEIEKCEKGLR